MRHTGHKGGKGANKRHEARQDDGHAAVALIKAVGLIKGLAVEPARVFPLENLGPQVAANRVIALVAQNGGRKQHDHGQRIVHITGTAQRPHDEHQRITGQEGHDHHAGFHKHDDEQQGIHPGAVGDDKCFQVLVDMQDEVDQKLNDFQNTVLKIKKRHTSACRHVMYFDWQKPLYLSR